MAQDNRAADLDGVSEGCLLGLATCPSIQVQPRVTPTMISTPVYYPVVPQSGGVHEDTHRITVSCRTLSAALPIKPKISAWLSQLKRDSRFVRGCFDLVLEP
jgi:hypothetical protein